MKKIGLHVTKIVDKFDAMSWKWNVKQSKIFKNSSNIKKIRLTQIYAKRTK